MPKTPGSPPLGRAIHGTSTGKNIVPMAYENRIPAGRYRSKILSVTDSTTNSGAEAVDVVYKLTSSTGTTYEMRERIPFDSYPYTCFGSAMIAAGLNPGDDPVDAVGVVEDVTLTYPFPGAIGHFTKRTPAAASSNSCAPADDEDDPVPGFDDEDDSDDDWL